MARQTSGRKEEKQSEISSSQLCGGKETSSDTGCEFFLWSIGFLVIE